MKLGGRKKKKQPQPASPSNQTMTPHPVDDSWQYLTVFELQMPGEFAQYMDELRQEDPVKYAEIMDNFQLTEKDLKAMKAKKESMKKASSK